MDVLGKLSGKAVADKVREYSEIYGEVLLGLNRDLEKHNRSLQDCQQRLVAQAKEIQRLRLLCVVSYLFALGVGGVMWLIR
jgi:hypothetical protein